MSRNVMLTEDKLFMIVWDVDAGYIKVYKTRVERQSDIPFLEERDISAERMVEIAAHFGVADVVRATLFGAY